MPQMLNLEAMVKYISAQYTLKVGYHLCLQMLDLDSHGGVHYNAKKFKVGRLPSSVRLGCHCEDLLVLHTLK